MTEGAPDPTIARCSGSADPPERSSLSLSELLTHRARRGGRGGEGTDRKPRAKSWPRYQKTMGNRIDAVPLLFCSLPMEVTHNGTHNTKSPGFSPFVASLRILVRLWGMFGVLTAATGLCPAYPRMVHREAARPFRSCPFRISGICRPHLTS